MAIVTIKPDILIKDKNSADPDVRLFRDSDSNKMLEAFESADLNFVELDQRIEDIEIINESQPISSADPLKFDFDYQVGSPFNPIASNITFDLTGAVVGTASSVFHQHSNAPSFGSNIDLAFINFTISDYGVDELNEFVFHYMEDPQNSNQPYLKVYHTKNITLSTPT
jgi:hypothetical protein